MFSRVDLHAAWKAKSAYFFCAFVLTIVSSLLYLLASLVDPGTLPKATLDKKLLAMFRSQSLEAGTGKVRFIQITDASTCLFVCCREVVCLL